MSNETTKSKRPTQENGKPIAFPDVVSFWDLFETVEPHSPGDNTIAEFGNMKLSGYLYLRNAESDAMMFNVQPTKIVIEWIQSNCVHIDYDTLYFQAVVRKGHDTLILVQHNQIIGSRYLAVVETETVPTDDQNVRKMNQDKMARQRERYIQERSITHEEYFAWLSNWIGLSEAFIPFKDKELLASTDKHFNDLRLRTWEACDQAVRNCFRHNRPGLHWSINDTVCCFKTLARIRVDRLKAAM